MIKINSFFGQDNRYKIISKLGLGGMGDVYKAYDTVLFEEVAIKILSLEDELAKKRFLNEAKVSLQLTHPNIIRVRDLSIYENRYYMVMEFIDGMQLDEFVLRFKLKEDFTQFYHLIRPILTALQFAHQYTIHRDIKPSNIMVRNNTAYLMDFGIASSIDSSILDESSSVIGFGTRKYVAPEQIINANDVDVRADIFSIGMVMYELLTGFTPKDLALSTPELPSMLNTKLSPVIDKIILKMISFKRENRYKNITEVLEAFDNLKENQNSESPITSQNNFLDIELIEIPSGSFMRGSSIESKIESEKPRKLITVNNFLMSKYCVTNLQYAKFINESGYEAPIDFDEICDKKPNHPVVNISYKDAKSFCKFYGYDLPTEAQWEKAARGDKNYQYPWGNEYQEDYANIDFSLNDTVSVDSFECGINPYGLYQMAGNVWEWCLDNFSSNSYKSSNVTNPCYEDESNIYVLRGGSFDFISSGARCAFRFQANKFAKENNIGFRVVKNEF